MFGDNLYGWDDYYICDKCHETFIKFVVSPVVVLDLAGESNG
jgi:hypothetical protein